jgi:hypothetical protein
MLPMPSGSRAEILVRQIKLVALLRGRGDSEVCARCLSDAPRERVPGISWDAVSTPSKEQSGLRLRSNRKPSPARCSPDSLQGVPQRPLRGACRIASEVLARLPPRCLPRPSQGVHQISLPKSITLPPLSILNLTTQRHPEATHVASSSSSKTIVAPAYVCSTSYVCRPPQKGREAESCSRKAATGGTCSAPAPSGQFKI